MNFKTKIRLRIISIVICLGITIVSQGQRMMDYDKITPFTSLTEADNYMVEKVGDGTFSGTVLVAIKGKVVFHKAYGYANKDLKSINKVDTKINIGSINKVFTGVSIMQLVEKGLLNLDDKAVKYIPELKNPMMDEITIRHLLQMSSGFGFYFDSELFKKNMKTLKNIEDYVPIISDYKLNFKPGSKKQYSNSGYELLGVIVQRVSGVNYYKYVKDNVYKKAGMINTDAYERDKKHNNLAEGYTKYKEGESMGTKLPKHRQNKFNTNVNEMHAVKGTAAGGGYSTSMDLYKYVTALYGNKLISEDITNTLLNGYEEKGVRSLKYGIGGGGMGINAMIIANMKKCML